MQVGIPGSIHPHLAGMNRAAQKVGDVGARAASGKPGEATDTVDLIAAERSFQANIRALQAADENVGVLLDVKT